MSHHFDTPTALEDPRINLCDFYLFRGAGETALRGAEGEFVIAGRTGEVVKTRD